MVCPGPTTISHRIRSRKKTRNLKTNSAARQSGFTLIELLIVLGIVAFIYQYGLPNFRGFASLKTKSLIRQITGINKRLHTEARLKNKTYRLVVILGEDKKKQGFSAEVGPENALLVNPETYDSSDKKNQEERLNKGFVQAADVLREPFNLPKGLNIEEVEVEGSPTITSGKAMIHFFPSGLSQKAVIKLQMGEKSKWSLIVNPITGDTSIRTEFVSLQDIGK